MATASYVAQYCLKKVNGKMAPDHYQGRLPEYTTSSRNPAIGLEWLKKYHSELYPRDYTVVDGVKGLIPKYYDKMVIKHNLTNPEEFAKLKAMRIAKAEKNPNNHPARLRAAEKIQKSRDTIYNKRSFESA